jgi:hypothetical protein
MFKLVFVVWKKPSCIAFLKLDLKNLSSDEEKKNKKTKQNKNLSSDIITCFCIISLHKNLSHCLPGK